MCASASHAYSHHVITLHVWFILIFTLVVKLAEEVEGHYSVEVHNHSQQTHRHHELWEGLVDSKVKLQSEYSARALSEKALTKCPDLFAIVSNRRQDGAQRFDSHRNIKEVTSKEEVVVVSEQRH